MTETLAPTVDAGRERRVDVLRRFGAAESDLDALLAYTENPFDFSGPVVLGDEPFVPVWEGYLAEANRDGVFPVLRRVLHQLRFPIREGMGGVEAYRAATRRGDLSALGTGGLFEGGLQLVSPETLRLELHPTPAGQIPVLTAPVREDFIALVQALTRRNEPTPLPDSMGALMVGGYNNWDRVRRYREAWERGGVGVWDEAFKRLVTQKELYQDRFILLSEGPYSGVPASRVGLKNEAWLRVSHDIRREHECAHYYCRRVLGSMRRHVHDEVIADAYALARAGRYGAGWIMVFMGIEDGARSPQTGGRMLNYCNEMPSDQVEVLTSLVRDWACRAADLATDSMEPPSLLLRGLAHLGLA